MEKLKLTRNVALALAVSGGALVLAGCAEEQPAPNPDSELTADDLYGNSGLTQIYPGQSRVIAADTVDFAEIRDKVPMIDHQYPHGFDDEMAPEVSVKPIRVDAHVALSGESPDLDNDLTCDTLRMEIDRLDRSNIYLNALALSESGGDNVMISWPKDDDGQPGQTVYVCMDDGAEPEHGVVLFLDDRPR